MNAKRMCLFLVLVLSVVGYIFCIPQQGDVAAEILNGKKLTVRISNYTSTPKTVELWGYIYVYYGNSRRLHEVQLIVELKSNERNKIVAFSNPGSHVKGSTCELTRIRLTSY